MIPISIEIENFRSFAGTTKIPLDFAPLFCIVGANGSGKSSIVEAILWALFGKSREGSRASSVRRTGANSVNITFDFDVGNVHYRVARSIRKKAQKLSLLRFDEDESEFVSPLKSHRLSDSQNAIEEILGADYAGLRLATFFAQNEASVFSKMLPSERRKKLGELLGIERYDILRHKACQLARKSETSSEQLRNQINLLDNQLAEIENPDDELKEIEKLLKTLSEKLEQSKREFENALTENNRLLALDEKKGFLKDSLESTNREISSDKKTKNKILDEKEKLLRITNKSDEIIGSYEEHKRLSGREREISRQASLHAKLTGQVVDIERKISHIQSEHRRKISLLEGELSQLESELEKTEQECANIDELRHKMSELKLARKTFDEISAEGKRFDELVRTANEARTHIDTEEQGLRKQLKSYRIQEEELKSKLSHESDVSKNLEIVQRRISEGEIAKKEIEDIRSKIGELESERALLSHKKSAFLEQWQELDKNLHFVETEDVSRCPLCSSQLDGIHKQKLCKRISSEKAVIETEGKKTKLLIENIELRIAEFGKELDKKTKTANIAQFHKQSQKLAAELATIQSFRARLQDIEHEINGFDDKLKSGQFSHQWREVLLRTEKGISELDFQSEALEKIKKLIDSLQLNERKWTIAEQNIERAKKLRETISLANDKLDKLMQTKIAAELEDKLKGIKEELNSSDYNPDEYEKVRVNLAALESAPQIFFEYQNAQERLPKLLDKLTELVSHISGYENKRDNINAHLAEIETELEQKDKVESKLSQFRKEFAVFDSESKKLQSRQIELITQSKRMSDLQEQKTVLYDKMSQHDSIANIHRITEDVLGPLGIQDWLLGRYLEQLESDANETLALLTDGELSIRLLPESDEKLMVNISDRNGERVYESYSGGEEFRIDFALRLALSRLLATRAGFPLRTLIIDEGFGSQDENGLSKLLEMLYDIQSQFDRIIVISHLPQFQNEFPARLEVAKDTEGSQVRVIA